MAIEFKPIPTAPEGPTEPQLVIPEPTLVLDPEEYDVAQERALMTQQLEGSKEIDSIVSTINAYEVGSVVTFGSETAEEISSVSDQVLRSIDMTQINESGRLLEMLNSVMSKFDLKEIAAPEPKGIFAKLKKSMAKQLDQVLNKYHTMGEEVDRIYVELKRYESEIMRNNDSLEKLFKANVGYYQQLVKYILAGEQGVKELQEHLAASQAAQEKNPDNMAALDIHSLQQVTTVLEQRVMDLKLAEHVAMQSLPMIRSTQLSNANLIRKINSAFIVTLPVFKQALAQAVMLKRQRIQTEAMSALDKRTNEMLLKNAQNTADQAKLTAQLANSSSIKVETLEKTWQTILRGIEETRQIQESTRIKREQESARLGRLMEEYQRHASR